MRIVFLLQDTGKVFGAERATLDLAGGLLEAGEDVALLLMEEERLHLRQSALRIDAARRNIPVDALPVASRLSRSLVEGIRAYMEDRRGDVLHTTGYKADIHGGLASLWGKVFPIVGTVHGWLFRPDLKERFYGWLNMRALRKFDRVVALSRYYEDLMARHGVRAERLARIPSGIDLRTMAAPIRPPDGPCVIGIMGRLSWEKNHALFLEAAERVAPQCPDVQFIIAGDGPKQASIQARLCDSGFSGRVELAGYMERDTFLSRVHVVVLCSRIENLPYSVLEAMAWSRPVIATRVGGLPDLVEHDRTGLLVDGDDAGTLADAMSRLANDSALRDRMGAEARRKQAEEFSLQASVEKHRALYQSLGRHV